MIIKIWKEEAAIRSLYSLTNATKRSYGFQYIGLSDHLNNKDIRQSGIKDKKKKNNWK